MALEKMYTPEEVAEHAHVSVWSVRRWLRDGKLSGEKVGGRGKRARWLVRESEVARLLGQ